MNLDFSFWEILWVFSGEVDIFFSGERDRGARP